VKFLYGEAFRAANAYELFYTQSGSRGNPDLMPERLTTTEIVFEQYLSGRVRLTAAGFATRINDLIDQTEIEGEVFHVNRGSAGATGLEAEAEYRSASGVLARGSIVAQRATDRNNGESLSNAPERLGTLQVAVPISTRDLTLGLDSTFVGQRLTRDGRALDAFWLSNLIATWQPRHTSLMVQGGVYNLFDQRYAHPVGSEFLQDAIVQDGRTASIKLTVRF
jgi:iron complex outermembrane receptor protein